MKSFILSILTILLPFSAYSQVEDYKLNNLSTDEGLPTDNILYAYQDSYGYLWLASFEGLIRWDGYNYKTYHHQESDSNSLAGNIVYTIKEDHKKRLWIGTIGGLNLYDREKDQFIQCKVSPKTEKIPINSLQADSKNQLWLGTSYGLCKYDHDNATFEWFIHNPTDENSLSDDVIFSLSLDRQDNIWIGTFEGGLNKFDPDNNTFRRFFHERGNAATICSNKINRVLVDKEENVWVGSFDKGVSLLNKEGDVQKHFSVAKGGKAGSGAENIVSTIYEDRNQTIWLGIERDQLLYKQKGEETFQPFLNTTFKKPGLICRSITSVCEDSFGNLWFASQSLGLFNTNIHKNVFRHYFKGKDPQNHIRNNIITCFYEDRQNNIWIGTDGGGLSLFDPRQGRFTTFSTLDGLSSNAIQDIKEDKNGDLWLASWSGGIIKFNPSTQKAESFVHDPLDENSLIFNNAKTLLPSDSLIWVGTHGEGLSVYDLNNKRFINQKNNTHFPFDLKEPAWINHLFQDSRGRIWISTYGGLYLYDGRELVHFSHSKQASSISSNLVNMVAEDPEGRIWLVSESGGLDLFNEKEKDFSSYNALFELPRTIKALTFDHEGKIWLSSNEGIVSFNPKDEKIERYDNSDGLQGNSFFHKAALTSADGSLYFGGPHGFNVFHPDSLAARQENFDIAVHLTNLYIYDQLQSQNAPGSPLKKVLSFTDTLVLLPHQSFFSIGYAAINLFSPSKIKYAYKLEGLHDNWINTGLDTKASFTNLNPGNYTFRVQYTDLKGNWQEAEKELLIVVLPPWYQTWWFKVLVALSTISLLVGLFYLRLSAIKRQNKLLEQEVNHRTQELSDANAYLIEKNEEIKHQNEKLEEYNQEVLRQSEKILIQQKENIAQNHILEETVEELHKSNQTKDKFFSILAHDLRNPVSALSGVAESLKLNLPNLNKKDIQEYVDSIHKSSQSVYQLLINLLNWSRTQSRNLAYTPTDFDLNPLIRKNIALLEQQLQNKNISLQYCATEMPKVFADYNMIDTVMRNLLSNSIKFTDMDGEVAVSCEETEKELIISVKDNGIGISEEQLAQLFKVEKKFLSKGTAGESGTGLGLVITQEFIEANQGRIKVSSEKGQGSVFSFSLPKSAATAEQLQAPDTQDQESGSTAFEKVVEDFPMDKLLKVKGKRILIIDDNKELRTYLRLNLSDTFEIFEAENGNEGLKMALDIQPTVIITDMMMPVMNGEQFCREVKSLPTTSHIPVILLTSQPHEEGQLSGYGAGADVYLMKPVKKELLFQLIYNLIQNQEKIHQRIMDSNSFYPDDVAFNKVDEEFLDEVIKVIEDNLSDPAFDYKLIGEVTAMSRTVLYAKIKTLTGQGVHEFIKSIRLKKSLKLLQEGKLNISQIAFEVGFNSPSYFNKCFIKQYNVTPKDYLKKARKLSSVD